MRNHMDLSVPEQNSVFRAVNDMGRLMASSCQKYSKSTMSHGRGR